MNRFSDPIKKFQNLHLFSDQRRWYPNNRQNYIPIVAILSFLFASLGFLTAQNVVYPVEVRPQMIAGGSVYLGDFADPLANSDKLRFTLTLQDPLEQERTVYFRVTIIQGSNVIATTINGFRGQMITLRKNEPYLITGEDLAQNLNIMSLSGLSGANRFGILNEGITDICIEVIDAFREEPISRRECASGYLARLQPPILILPVESQNIYEPQLNNTVFTWQMTDPLAHLPNSRIRYQFELRQQTPLLDPRDQFENHLLIYSETLDHFSIFYNEVTSQLEPNTTYLWRVTALFYDQFGNQAPYYFNNNGISRIGVFHVMPDRTIVPESTTISCFCPDGDCNPAPVSYRPAGVITTGDSVRFGNFYLRIDELQGSTGSGRIHMPLLNASVAVNFSGLFVNNEKVATSGQVKVVSSDLTLNMGMDKDRLPVLPSAESESSRAEQIREHLNGNSENKTLPVSLGHPLASYGFSMPYDVWVTDIRFNSQRGVEADLVMPVTGPMGQTYYFGASGVRMGKYGMDMDGLKLYLLNEEIEIPGRGANPVLVHRSVKENESEGTYVSFNCEGLEGFNLQASYEFPTEILKPVDGSLPSVQASLILKAKEWGRFSGKGEITPFTAEGAPGWSFDPEEILIDLDPLSTPDGIRFPEAYAESGPSWMGFYLNGITVGLPKYINMAAGESVSYQTPGILLDEAGIHCRCGGSEILDLSTGKAGGWAFAIDTINLNISRNKFVEAHVGGQVGMDVLDGQISYQGLIFKDKKDNYGFNLSPVGSLEIPFLKIKAEILSGSELVVQKPESGGTYKPYADLNLRVGILAKEEDFRSAGMGDVIDGMRDILRFQDFDFGVSEITFQGFRINHPELPKGKYFGLEDINGGKVSIPGLGSLSLSGLTLLDEETDFSGETLPGLGLEMRVNIGLASLGVAIWAKEDAASKTGYSFGKYELIVPDFSSVSFRCDCNAPDENKNNSVPVNYCDSPVYSQGKTATVSKNDRIKVGHFAMIVDEITGKGGKGRIEIPFLGSRVEVDFENLDVQESEKDGKWVKSGHVVTAQNELLRDGAITIGESAGALDMSGFGDMPSSLDQVEDVAGRVGDFFTLPISLSQSFETLTGVDIPEGFDFVLLGVRFTPEGARMSAMVTLKVQEDNYLKFGLTGVHFRPDGFNMDGIQIYLAEDFSLKN